MSIAEWIEERKLLKLLNPPRYFDSDSDPSKGLWTLCDRCRGILYIKHLKENNSICSSCSYHLRMSSHERLDFLLDKGSWRPLDETLSPCDPLEFHDQKDYTERLKEAQERTGLQDAIQTGSGLVDDIPIAIGVMDFDFMGGSMGSVVGEKVTRLIEYASQEGLTLVLVCASGGARMQEGVLSLMQMAKISSALQVYQTCANLLYISLLTSPTTGGVTASFAMLGDIIIAEPEALIAFAGRRVIEQTLCEDLPADFQTSEYMFQHGLLDLIVPRRFLRQALSECIRFYVKAPHKKPGRIPFGVQNPINSLIEEKIRRQWGGESSSVTSLRNTSPLSSSNNSSVVELSGVSPTKESTTVDSQSKKSDPELSTKQEQEHNVTPHSTVLSSKSQKEQKQKQEVNSLLDTSKKESIPSQNISHLSHISEAAANMVIRADLQPKRETVEYRNILTSYQTMFDLFSKQLVFPFSSKEIQNSVSNTEITVASQNTNESKESNASADRLLQKFMLFSQNQEVNRVEGSDITVTDTYGETHTEQLLEELTSQPVENGITPSQSTYTEKQDLNSSKSTNDLSKQSVSYTDSKKEVISFSSNCVDFLNQSIELAGTEIVEWRAFYVHQKISEKTGFLEDFLSSYPEYKSDSHTTFQNTLLYRSICRTMN